MNLQELLFVNLSEECAEVIQASSKCLRFTKDHKYYKKSNIQILNEELNQLTAVIMVLQGLENEIQLDEATIKQKTEQLMKGLQLSNEMLNNAPTTD